MKASEPLQNDQSTATEKALRLAFDTTPAFIHTARPDGYFDYFNRRWLDFLGKSLEDVCGWRWTESVHPEDVAGIVQKWRAALASGEPFEAEARVRCGDGTYRAFLHRKVPLHDEHGNIVKWFGSSIDIEDRKRAEERRPLEAELQATLNVIPAYTWYALPSGALTFVNERTADYLGIPKDHPLRLGIHTGAEWDSHIPLLHPDDHEETRRNWSTRLRTGSAGEGSFRVRNAQGGYRWFLSRVEPLRASDGTLLYWVGVNLDIEERKRAEEELRRSKAYLSEAQRLSHTGSFGWDLSSGEIYWSEETFRIFEYDRAVTPTVDLVVQRVHPEDRADVQSVIERASGGAPGFEHAYRLLMPDGRVKHVHALAHATQDASGNREFVGAVTDITDQRRAEESLRESESYLAEAQKLSHTGSWAWSPDTDVRYWSEECYRVLGFDPRDGSPRMEELIQRIHPDDQPAFRESTKRSKHTKVDEEVDYRIVLPDGAVRDIHSIGHPVFSASGDLIEFTGTVIDITERKRAEEELRRNEYYLAEGQRLAHMGSWVFDPAGFFNFWSRELFRIYGFDPAKEGPTLEEYLACVHPQDREFMRSLIKRMLAEASGCDVTKRIVRSNGEVRYVRCVGAPVIEDGTLKRIVGTAIDVTEHELLTQELRSREAYLAEAQRLSHTGSFGWNLATGELVWSDENFRIIGYEPTVKPTVDLGPEASSPGRSLVCSANDGEGESRHEFGTRASTFNARWFGQTSPRDRASGHERIGRARVRRNGDGCDGEEEGL